MFRVSGDLQHAFRAGSEQQIVKNALVPLAQRCQFVRQSENHVKVAGGQQLHFPRRQPSLASLCLTLRAVAVAARVVGDGRMSAAGTIIDMAAEFRSSAAGNGIQRLELLEAELALVTIDEGSSVRANNVGHLEGGPAHSGLRSLRESGT